MKVYEYCPVCGEKLLGAQSGRYVTLSCDECGSVTEVV